MKGKDKVPYFHSPGSRVGDRRGSENSQVMQRQQLAKLRRNRAAQLIRVQFPENDRNIEQEGKGGKERERRGLPYN